MKSRIDAAFGLFPGKTLHRFASLGMKSRIDAAFGLFPGKTLHRFASLGMKSRIDAAFGLFPGKTLHRFASLGMKSRIDAAFGLFPEKTLQRFASLGPKSRIDVGSSPSSARTTSTDPQNIPQHAFHHALKMRLALDVAWGGHDAGSVVAAKAGADAPGGGISLCFCRRGCAAPA